MACTCPLDAWPPLPEEADRRPRWKPTYRGAVPYRLPCGKCLGCRLDRAKDWSTRLYHENMMHEESCFITLTYSDEHLPDDYSVNKRTMQLFMKRLRKAVGEIRFFLCGEYGDGLGRPHYHVLLFGHSFPDRILWRKTASGHFTYRSAVLERLWPFGHSEVGHVTPESAQYVARYVVKKMGGDKAAEHYSRINPITGETVQVTPEFVLMSRNPGIGSMWFDKFARDAFPSDFVIVNGQKRRVPKYYLSKLSETEAEVIKRDRKEEMIKRLQDGERRLMTKHELTTLKANSLRRSMEDGQ